MAEITVVITAYQLEKYIGSCLEELFPAPTRISMSFWSMTVPKTGRPIL